MKILEQIKNEHIKFDEVCTEYAKFGAADSEPDGIYQRLILNAAHSKFSNVPKTSDGWELFRGMKGNQTAAMALATQTQKIIDLIKQVPMIEIPTLKEWAKEVCWRCC